jgi:hypothetical protein
MYRRYRPKSSRYGHKSAMAQAFPPILVIETSPSGEVIEHLERKSGLARISWLAGI